MKPETMSPAVRTDPLPFCRPSLDEREAEAVLEVLHSGWLTSGPQVKWLEQEFAEYVGAAEALAVTSCTAAQHLVMHALDLKPGDEVIVPSLTWPSTVNTIVLAGGRPVFADVDPVTANLDPASVEERVTERTRAIVPVHFAGRAADLPALQALAEAARVPLIHDAAHAAGTELLGERIGSGVGPTVFSFHPIKNMTTGEGGMITTDDGELAARLRRLRFHGIERDAWSRYRGKGAAQYAVIEPGFKYNLPDILAAIGRVQLAKLDALIAKRTRLAHHYDRALAALDDVLVRPPIETAVGERHAWHLYTVQLRLERIGLDRDAVMSGLQELGISTGLHFNAVHLHPYYIERFGMAPGDLPITESIAERIVSLPLFPEMSESDVEDVVTALKQVTHGDH
ncbi:MAG: aminotransferase class I/II-fold pyridoxal phosphate-dependent enzyme [Planctomycetota bacterium]